MLTLHLADAVRTAWDAAPLTGAGVAVEGTRVAAVGPAAELRQRFPGARERHWPGVLGPARVHEGPLPEAPSPRERVHAVLKLGAAAVLAAAVDTPDLRDAARRTDVAVLPAVRAAAVVPGGRADLAVFDADGTCLATVCAGRLVHRRR